VRREKCILRAVGQHDSRNSMKMKRRKAQAKKKARVKRRTAERKTVTTGVKKPAARKRATAPTSVSSGPATTPTGTAPAN
jgi:hypothetical protein